MKDDAPGEMALNLVEVDGRFARFEAIEWWEQARLRAARVLVVGAGALGNEVVKNLALLGVGQLVIVDRERIELSNLSRSVLYRERDRGEEKAFVAARTALDLYPEISVAPLTADVLVDVGLGVFRWADVVVGALDSREARVFVNSACARMARPWIDGGIEVLNGIARGFHAPATACYECTMTQRDWDLLNERRSCALLARRALEQRGTPTTPTTASVIGAIQAQEVVKLLHGRAALLGRGFVFEGLNHSSYPVQYAIKPDCPWHETVAQILAADDLTSDAPLGAVWEMARHALGGLDALELGRELVWRLACARCHTQRELLAPIERLDERQVRCERCGEPRVAEFLHSLAAASPWLERSARSMGLPLWDIVWGRYQERYVGIELGGDRDGVLRFLTHQPSEKDDA